MYAEHLNGDRELYDLQKDPYELQSEHANPAYDAIRASLAARLHNLVGCAGATCRARPSLRYTAARVGRCGVVKVAVSGQGITAALFSANGRTVARDSRPPFQANLRFKNRAVVRARVATGVDQVVTADRTVRGCS
jgi:hypothetical protein